MRRIHHPLVVVALLIAFFAMSVRPAEASIPTGTEIVLIFVAVGVVGAAIGVGIYYATRKAPSITGCAVATPNGFTLMNESDQKTYMLIGDTAGVRGGERVRVKGKKKKKDAAQTPTFLVDQMTKDFGVCKVTP